MTAQKKETDNGSLRAPIKTKSKREQLKEKPIEVTLWDAANKLRGSVEPA